MNKDEKELNEEKVAPEEKQGNQEVKYEENDNWQFEAEAPTLGNKLTLGDGFEIEAPIEKKPKNKAKKAKPAKNESIVINKKTLKVVVLSFVSAVLVAAIIALGAFVFVIPNSSEKMTPGNVALKVGNTKVSVGMYNLYYNLIVSNYEQYASNGYYNIDFTKDFDKQETVDENGEKTTWAEVFKQDTIRQLKYIAAYYEPAVEEGITLTDEQEESIKGSIDSLKTSAIEAGLSFKEYLEQTYGKYCGEATIEKFYEQRNICQLYYNKMAITDSVSEKEALEYYEKNKDNYVTFAYLENQFNSADADAMNKAKQQAKEYSEKIKNLKDLKDAIPSYCKDLIDMAVSQGYFADKKSALESLNESAVITSTADDVKTNFGEEVLKWFQSSDRKDGDTMDYVNEEKGYACVFLYTSEAKQDQTELYSVRHILISPKDDPSTVSEATDKEWAAALLKAEQVYNEYDKSDKTEAAFAELAEQYSADTASLSSGGSGAYGGIYSRTELGTMVPEFEKWATDKSRKYGDVGIVKTDYGYHVMYFIYDGPAYIFNLMDDAYNKKGSDRLDAIEYKQRYAFRSTTKAEPTTTTTEAASVNTDADAAVAQ
ncbi:MAG: peptidyl-prolyl cis-trans isomerase [Eubacterium sp.]|nr:peptidyl-prolyl cis-trans isomerase [Eubacterium sp.]